MLEAVFTWLSNTLNANPLMALTGSFIWGVLSILLSPCHLASVPLIVGFISEQGELTLRRAFWLATLFSVGILITIALVGVITGLLGRMLGDVGSYGNYIVAAIFVFVGLHLVGVIPLNISAANASSVKRKGLLAAFVLGLVFGIALGPCTFAFMAPMLGIAFSIAAQRFLFAVALILAYAIGHCAVIVAAGTSAELEIGRAHV